MLDPGGDESLVEVDVRLEGSLGRVKVVSLWTYWSATHPDGSMYGEGEGVLTTEHGDIIRLKGSGAGRAVSPGSELSYRGAVYFQTNSETYAHLNSTVGVHEHQVQPDGSTSLKVYEWK